MFSPAKQKDVPLFGQININIRYLRVFKAVVVIEIVVNGGKMEKLMAFEKHKEKVIQEMHERFLIYKMKKKKKVMKL